MSHLIENGGSFEGLPLIEFISSPENIRPRLKKYVSSLEMEIDHYFFTSASDRCYEIEAKRIESVKRQVYMQQIKQIRNSKVESKRQLKYNAQIEAKTSSIVEMKQIMREKENAHNQLSTRNASRLNINKMHFLIKRRIEMSRKDGKMVAQRMRTHVKFHEQNQGSLKLPHCG